MTRTMVAGELVRLARELVGMDFPTQDAMDKYLKDHPAADKTKHHVKQDQDYDDTREEGEDWLQRDTSASLASELLTIAHECVGMDFPDQKAMDKYLKEHPDADRSKHRVVPHDPSDMETHPFNLMRRRKNEEALEKIGKYYKKNPKDLTVDEIESYNRGGSDKKHRKSPGKQRPNSAWIPR